MSDASHFTVRSVAHLVRPAGLTASTVDALATGIAQAPGPSLFYHAVQHQLRLPDADEPPPDDFSAWLGGVLQLRETAERCAFMVQTRNRSEAELREALLDLMRSIPGRSRHESPEGGEFVFLIADSVTVPVSPPLEDVNAVIAALLDAGPAAWFLHLIEEPWQRGDEGSLIGWLRARGEGRLSDLLAELAHAGLPIEAARQRLARQLRHRQLGRRIAEAAGAPERERRVAAREAVSGIVRRLSPRSRRP